ncbi:carbohydrate ABC transporter permease [Paenibacillus soyae]|uniref:Maltose/maltodextrin transport system permease protein n=1 Tax=Paenibacillus soyae TaxID=2969249 RepID=A0A9X2SCE0_9BACL|nr:sugar ABC transporter permease [Paenibacillus soyae]MCR2806678.1 sugar ABC transporter permease [Paenibacillus soyae]
MTAHRIAGAWLSVLLPGLGQLYHRQLGKGLSFAAVAAAGWYAIVFQLAERIEGLLTLGTNPSGFRKVGKLSVMMEGDHSIFLMVEGLIALFLAFLFAAFYLLCVRDAYRTGMLRERGDVPPRLKESLKQAGYKHFAYVVLFIPLSAVLFLTVLPLVFSILLAFTNYADPVLPPAHLLDWVGLQNFVNMLRMDIWSGTFTGILSWTIVWAVLATVTTYVGGVLVAILISQPRLRWKRFWRTALIVPFAIPNMVSLLVMRNMFNNQFGPVNRYLAYFGIEGIPWLTDPFWAKATVILVNMWIGMPVTMILAFGVLTTIPKDWYEAAEVDGAGTFQKLRHITFPMVLFSTAPLLIMQFAGNMNNFNVIYLLTNGDPVNIDYQFAGHTDLLVTWLYKLALNQSQFSYASVIGIAIFLIVASLSIWSYTRTKSYREEDMIQ